MSLIQALICGIWVFIARAQLFYWFDTFFMNPLATGICLGAVLGNWELGAQIGATVQTMYLVNYGVGSVFTNDSVYAGVVPVAFAICNGMPQEAAIAICVPFGILAAQLINLVFVLIASVAPKFQEAAERGDDRGVRFWGSWMPLIIKAVFWIPLTAVLLLLGGDAVTGIVNSLPEWVMSGLATISSVLPGLGYAMIMHFIGRDDLLPFFLGGFFFATYSGLPAIPIAAVGAFIAYLVTIFNSGSEGEYEEEFVEESTEKRILSRGDVLRFWFGTQWWGCAGHNTLTMHASGLATPMSRVAKKIYVNDPEEYKECLRRATTPYITNFNFGGLLNGALLSLEEQRGINRDSIPAEMINSTKYALAGPLAAVGDTIDSVAFMPVIYGIGTAIALQGQYWACLVFPLLLSFLTTAECFLSVTMGYRLGSNAAVTMLSSGKVKKFLEFMSIMGMFTLAGVSASMVNVQLALSISQGAGDPIMIQSILDTIMPHMLSLAAMLGMYSYLRKGGNVIKLMVILIVGAFALGVLGILA